MTREKRWSDGGDFLVATLNVNGIRAAVRKGMLGWLSDAAPDVLLLQEVRADADIAENLLHGTGYQVVVEPSRIKGRAGVAVLVADSLALGDVSRGIGSDEPDGDTGRVLSVDLPDVGVRVTSMYLHSADAKKPEKMAEKYAHLDRVENLMAEYAQSATPTIVGGDFNIVRSPYDIKNWKPNHNKASGVLDEEIAYLDRWVRDLGFHDVVRDLAGEVDGPYSWWSQRGKAFDNNVGWRIDYQFASGHVGEVPLAHAAQEFAIERAASYAERFSDHAPVLVHYAL
ncbi:MAG: exodeoxyribonuclease III [Actinomycetaceae bacterium]|nr:exodeoxyribonuclease III [Actinomycetaceae bacterium]MDY6082913.1 exodeoxyribonuclease III [Actinomycetaceae bacterium]